MLIALIPSQSKHLKKAKEIFDSVKKKLGNEYEV